MSYLKKFIWLVYSIFVFIFGLFGLYRTSGLLFRPSANFFTEQEKVDVREMRSMASALGYAVDATMESSNLVRRNYNRGYFAVFSTKADIDDVLGFYKEKLIDEGYNVTVYSDNKKIRAAKDKHVVVIRDESDKKEICQYSIYIKPNDIFEWRSFGLYFLDK